MNHSAMPSPQEREAALFALAVEKPPGERSAFLQVVCGEDKALRQRLEALLAAHEQTNPALDAQPESAPAAKGTMKLEFAEVSDEAIGQKVGRYKLLERVGEGGCGVVYVAEQTEPVRRRVALKVIKLGMDTKAVVARFEAERQALAMMDHPNIAQELMSQGIDAMRKTIREKDRTRRYETANGLAADLKRHLNNEPVVARPPSAAYRFQKAVRRNKLIFVAGTAVVVALVAGIGMSTWQAAVARLARNTAETARMAESEQRRAAQAALEQAKAEGLRADQKAREARLSLYAADMKLAQLALAGNDLGRAVEILQNHKPGPGDADVRGFEWRYLWQQARGQETASLRITNSSVVALDFSPNGRWLAVAGFRGAKIIDVATWREKVALADTNMLLAIQFSPDGESLVTSGEWGVRIWDTLTWQPKQELESSFGLAAFAPDGLILATLGLSGLQIWDAHSLRLLHHFSGLAPRLQWNIYGNLAFSRDGHSLAALVEETAAATDSVSIRIWNVDHLRANGADASPKIINFPEVASVAALALSEDGKHLATSTVLGQLSVWDTSTGARLASHRDLAYRTHRLQYRAGNETLIGGVLRPNPPHLAPGRHKPCRDRAVEGPSGGSESPGLHAKWGFSRFRRQSRGRQALGYPSFRDCRPSRCG